MTVYLAYHGYDYDGDTVIGRTWWSERPRWASSTRTTWTWTFWRVRWGGCVSLAE